MTGTRTVREIQVGDRAVRISTPDRVLWPAVGFTKRQMIEYYAAVAPALLPHVRDRPMTLGRWPEGVDRAGWFQAECRGRPEWLAVHESIGRRGQRINWCLVNDLASLVFVANLGTIELHPFLWRVPDRSPTALVFDLDPGPPATLLEACEVGLRIRDLLPPEIAAVPKTSGQLGLHVVVPIAPGETFERTKAFARSVAGRLARARPDLVVESSARAARSGRVFVDWVQNDPGRSTVAPFSLRATAWPLVAMPVRWDEIEAAVRRRSDAALRFGPAAALDRLAESTAVAEPLLRPGVPLPRPTGTTRTDGPVRRGPTGLLRETPDKRQ